MENYEKRISKGKTKVGFYDKNIAKCNLNFGWDIIIYITNNTKVEARTQKCFACSARVFKTYFLSGEQCPSL